MKIALSHLCLVDEIPAILVYLEVIEEAQLEVVGAEQALYRLSWTSKKMALNGSRTP